MEPSQRLYQTPLLTEAEEKALGKKIQNGDKKALKRLVEANMRLVAKLANELKWRAKSSNTLSFDDLIQEGTLGLMKAAERFNPELGWRFSTYATWWIRQSIKLAFYNKAKTIRLPVQVAQALERYNGLVTKLTAKLNRKPSLGEIATATGLSFAEIEDMQQIGANTKQVEIVVDAPMDQIFSLTSDNPSFEVDHDQDVLKEQLEKMLAGLSEREQIVLSMRFGLEDGKESTLDEIAEKINRTRERARQIIEETINKLRKRHSVKVLLRDFKEPHS